MKIKVIIFKEVNQSFLKLYDKVAMNVDVHSEYKVERINHGLGWFLGYPVKSNNCIAM